jgi:cytochrome c
MDSFEINKILGALLGTCLILVAMHIASEAIFTREAPAKPGYEIVVKEQPAGGAAAAAAPAEQPIETLLASASPQHGAQVAKECEACHNLQEGQGPKVGPDLYGVVDRPIASVSGFNYTDAIKGAAKTLGGKWSFDALNKWLTKPSAVAPGTAMTFAGISSEKQRADVIDFLDTLSAHPVPLPKAAQTAPAKPSAAAAAPAPAAAPANPAPAANPPAANPPAGNPAANPPAAGSAPAAPAGGAAPAQH